MGKKVKAKAPKNASRRHFVRGLLVSRGIPSREIARNMGVSDAAVCLTLSGQKSRRIQTAIAEALGMPFKEVWGYPAEAISSRNRRAPQCLSSRQK